MSLPHNFSCDCSVPAGDAFLVLWNHVFEGSEGSERNLRRAPLALWPKATSSSGEFHPYFIWSTFTFFAKTKPNLPPEQPMRKDTWMKAGNGHGSRQSLGKTSKQCSGWDMKSQEEMIPYDFFIGLVGSGQDKGLWMSFKHRHRTALSQSGQSTLAF